MYQIYQADTQKCFDTKSDPPIALLQIRSTPLGPVLPGPATLLFSYPVRGIMPILTRLPLNLNNDEEHYEALISRQTKMIGTIVLPEIVLLFQ